MTPTVIRFTGFDFDPKVLYRRLKAPTPAEWVRYQFCVENYDDPEWSLVEWLTNNLYGRWTLNCKMTMDGYTVVIGFEQDNDAVMFRLMEGETAWREGVSKVL